MTDAGNDPDLLSRREALARVAWIMGGALAATTIAGAERMAYASDVAWVPSTLSVRESDLVATLAEHIIPTTDTPGARAAGVHRFVDALLTSYYAPAERDRFLAGLRGVDTRAREAHGCAFLDCTPRDQVAIMERMDDEAYPPREVAAINAQLPATAQRSGTAPAPGATADGPRPEQRRDSSAGWFFRRLKELTLTGYYTSRIGATRELHVAPMGAYHGDLPLARIGRAWA